MLFRRPCYYDDFHCKADKCTDNCCIGWEICIDSKTCQKYSNTKGAFGERLCSNIDFSDEPSFILNGERCPFLNENNLCDIIINMGEDSLCQICRDHPRYFEWYGNTKEGGLGLSCEEAARLILTDSCYADYFEGEVDEEPDEDFDSRAFEMLFALRERIFDLLCDYTLPLTDRFNEILSLCQGAEAAMRGGVPEEAAPAFSFEKELEFALPVLEKTEAIDGKWTDEFERLKKNSSSLVLVSDKNEETLLERLFAYFVWRYFLKSVFDGEITEKIRFALFSVSVIFALYKNQSEQSFNTLLSCAVLYSKQMEYSTENLDFFYESIYNL